MSLQTRFFATKSDLLDIMESAEQKSSLKYTRAGRFIEPLGIVFFRSQDIPDLGTASNESSSVCTRYLISPLDVRVVPRHLSSEPQFAYDQLINPKTVAFSAGGLWRSRILIQGSFGTASKDPVSLDIMKLLRSAFRKYCVSVKGHYLGVEAENLWKQGMRLTIADQSPPKFNLSP